GLGFAFNGFTLNSLMWPHCMASLAWMPFVVLTVERAWQEGGRFLIAAVLMGTMQMLAGPPEIVLITWLIASSLWLGHCAFEKLPVWTSLKRFPFVVLMIAGMAAVLLLPFLEFLKHSQRDAGYSTTGWSMPPTGWANLLVPLFNCSKTAAGPYMQSGQAMTSSYYLGIGMLALALVVGVIYLLRRVGDRRKQGVFGVILLVVCWLDVASHAPPQNPTVARTVYEPGRQPLQELKPKPKPGESRAMVSFSARFRFQF